MGHAAVAAATAHCGPEHTCGRTWGSVAGKAGAHRHQPRCQLGGTRTQGFPAAIMQATWSALSSSAARAHPSQVVPPLC